MIPALTFAEQAAEERRLLSLLDEFLAGASANDATMHERFWASDLVYTSSSGTRVGKAEIMQSLTADSADDSPDDAVDDPAPTNPEPRYWAEDQQVLLMGDTAVVAFRLAAETPQENGTALEVAYFFNTGTFRLRDGLWQAVAWQATRIPPDRQ